MHIELARGSLPRSPVPVVEVVERLGGSAGAVASIGQLTLATIR